MPTSKGKSAFIRIISNCRAGIRFSSMCHLEDDVCLNALKGLSNKANESVRKYLGKFEKV